MSISRLPLSYCTNVHPGRSIAEVLDGLDHYTVPVQQRVGHEVAAGLWLAQPVVNELLQRPDGPRWLADQLQQRNLSCYTLNAFPFGDFHSARVKEKVYQPDWTAPARLDYTEHCASILAALLPPDTEGSISTLPLGFKAAVQSTDFAASCIQQLLRCARFLNELFEKTGRIIRLAVEPEPLCLLETTGEAIAFFRSLFDVADQAGMGEITRRHLGLCYDICHQAVEFEDPAESVRLLHDAGIRINKVHISCALELKSPAKNAAGRAALAQYVEPRYLHQVIAQSSDGRLHRLIDLERAMTDSPPEQFLNAIAWRIHFHVPIGLKSADGLETTHAAISRAIQAVAGLDYAPHLEVETYTWNVLPGRQVDLVSGLADEIIEARRILDGPERDAQRLQGGF
jgi:sugar phosphate isomerase/epimerase